jgi:hypothetical protein
MSKMQPINRRVKRRKDSAKTAKLLRDWYARLDSNQRPFAPEANALSRLSYGRILDLMAFPDAVQLRR